MQNHLLVIEGLFSFALVTGFAADLPTPEQKENGAPAACLSVFDAVVPR